MSAAGTSPGLIRGRITDADIELLKRRIGYTNPTLRAGVTIAPWNPKATADAIRRYAMSIGDDNPFYVEPGYAQRTRWGAPLAPPGFEWSMGWNRSPEVSKELNAETHKALRGVQLYHSGAEYFYYRPVTDDVELYKSEWLADIAEKQSRFANRSVITTNRNAFWDQHEQVAITSSRWFVHAERRALKDGESAAEKEAKTKEASAQEDNIVYTDQQREEIEAAYDNQFLRGANTLYLEDAVVGQSTPLMVKGPLTITDMINMHMGTGWITYPNLPFRLAYENRKRLRGFYSLNEYGAWDSIQRVHWDASLAHSIGVKHIYDIGPMRFVMLCHYLTNFAGDDAWIHRIRYELRNFNYVGDTTWLSGTITAVRVDDKLGPLLELKITGVNQRGQENLRGEATILVASRQHGPVRLPTPPAMPQYRSSKPTQPGI
jgi:acyl dehydratase